MNRQLTARAELWPLREPFRISRGVKTDAHVVVAEVTDGEHVGRGECVPYQRYGESVAGVLTQIDALAESVTRGLDRDTLRAIVPPGAARNAVDCALWDLEARAAGRAVWQLAGLPAPRPLTTAFTLSLDTPSNMEAAARRHAHRPLLKLKLDGVDVIERIAAVREAAPAARLIVDANEAWTALQLSDWQASLQHLRVELIEQPLPAGADAALAEIARVVPVAADESCHVTADLDALRGRYDFVNVKLDKTGGLTEALHLLDAARAASFGIFVGCMVTTSLGIAPALLLGSAADYVDLDGPLLLARDRDGGVSERDGLLLPAQAELWGGAQS